MRVLWEVAHQDDITASQLVERLGIDAGYVSRVLRGFRERGLVKTGASEIDGRICHLKLTTRGLHALRAIEALLEPQNWELDLCLFPGRGPGRAALRRIRGQTVCWAHSVQHHEFTATLNIQGSQHR